MISGVQQGEEGQQRAWTLACPYGAETKWSKKIKEEENLRSLGECLLNPTLSVMQCMYCTCIMYIMLLQLHFVYNTIHRNIIPTVC